MNVLLHIAWLVFAVALAAPVSAVDPASTLPTAPAPPPEEPLFAVPTQMDRIGRVLAPVMINGKGPFRLIIDTGANHSTISPALVAKLGLVPSQDNQKIVHGVTGSALVPTVLVDRIEAGLLVVEGARLPVIWSSMTSEADGILGVAGLQYARIIVDFRRDRVSITRSRPRDDPRDFLVIDASRMPDGVLVVNASVRGVRAKAIIDTGAERTLGNIALRDAVFARRRNVGDPRWTEVFGATSEISKGQSVVAPAVILGDITVNRVDITYGDFPIFNTWNLQDRPAMLIGMDVLGVADTLIIDFHQQEIRVRRPRGAYVTLN